MFKHFIEVAHRAHIRAQHAQLTGVDEAEIDARVGPSSGPAGYHGACGFKRFHALVPGGGTDVFEDDVNAFPVRNFLHLVRNLLLVMVDHVVGA